MFDAVPLKLSALMELRYNPTIRKLMRSTLSGHLMVSIQKLICFKTYIFNSVIEKIYPSNSALSIPLSDSLYCIYVLQLKFYQFPKGCVKVSRLSCYLCIWTEIIKTFNLFNSLIFLLFIRGTF